MFTRYNDKGELFRTRSVIDCEKAVEDGEEIRVEQSHKEQVNINNIVKRHGLDMIAKTAQVTQLAYDDVSTNDFTESMNLIAKGRQTFESLPSAVRKEFNHDPAVYMDYIHNPENKQALIDRGWMKPPEPDPQPVEVRVINPEPDPQTGGDSTT
jgi:hypothetical protein